jgi:hypothetical protein
VLKHLWRLSGLALWVWHLCCCTSLHLEGLSVWFHALL